MSVIYVGNLTSQNMVLCYRTGQFGLDGYSGGPNTLTVPPNSVAQTPEPDIPTSICNNIVALWATYGIGPWSGSGVGYSIDTPITL